MTEPSDLSLISHCYQIRMIGYEMNWNIFLHNRNSDFTPSLRDRWSFKLKTKWKYRASFLLIYSLNFRALEMLYWRILSLIISFHSLKVSGKSFLGRFEKVCCNMFMMGSNMSPCDNMRELWTQPPNLVCSVWESISSFLKLGVLVRKPLNQLSPGDLISNQRVNIGNK